MYFCIVINKITNNHEAKADNSRFSRNNNIRQIILNLAKKIDLQFRELHKAVTALNEDVKGLKDLIKASNNKIITENELLKILEVSSKTLRSYRANGLISYSQIGNKFFYRQRDVDLMLNEARIEGDYNTRA